MVFAGTETGYSSGIYKCDSGTASSIYKPSIYEGWAKFTNSASSCDAWIEIEDTYGDCINYGTAATTIKYSQCSFYLVRMWNIQASCQAG